MGDEDVEGTRWAEVLAKSTAFLALQAADLGDDLLTRAKFLEALGVKSKEAAAMLGAHEGSLRNAKARERKGKSNGKAKK
jgi:hypothetical protein